MTYYDLNMNSKKLTATTGVERTTSVASSAVGQNYIASNSSATTSTELRTDSGSQATAPNASLICSTDANNVTSGYYAYSGRTPGLFLRNPIIYGTNYCVLSDNYDDGNNELTQNSVILYTDNSSYLSNYVELQSAFNNISSTSRLRLGFDRYQLVLQGVTVQDIVIGPSTSSFLNTYRNIKFNTDNAGGTTGILANSTINGVPTGSTTLTNAQAFQTIINAPSAAGRIFVLPAPSAANIGYWWEVCNKSGSFTITINSSAGSALATIPSSSGFAAGNVARVGIDSAGTGYFRTQ
jgi:hypothetical protein